MRLFRIGLIFLMGLLCSSMLSAQEEMARDLSIERDTINFTLSASNNLLFELVINDQDTLNLMFHIASSDVSLTKAVMEKVKSVQFSQVDSVSSWGGKHQTRVSLGNTIDIGTIELNNVNIFEGDRSGPGTDGKFGIDLFHNKVVELNYTRQQLIISGNLPANIDAYQSVSGNIDHGVLFVDAWFELEDQQYNNSFLLHSGYAGGLLLDNDFVEDMQLKEKMPILDESILLDSYGNEIRTIKSELSNFNIGKSEITDVPVSFFEGTIGRQSFSIIGGEVLKRFDFVFDFVHQKIYLKTREDGSLTLSNQPSKSNK